MNIEFPYVRVTPIGGEGLPKPVLLIELAGLASSRLRPRSEQLGHLHSELPASWLLPAVGAGLQSVGVTVPGDWVHTGSAWLAWVDIDLRLPAPDLSTVDFSRYVQARHV